MSDEVSLRGEVLAANDLFYAAFRSADLATMDTLWSTKRRVSAYHPGWFGIEGRADVMASWHQVMVRNNPPDVHPIDISVILNGNTAVVFCIEDVGPAQLIASNVFVKEGRSWMLTHHQAMPLPDFDEDDDEI